MPLKAKQANSFEIIRLIFFLLGDRDKGTTSCPQQQKTMYARLKLRNLLAITNGKTPVNEKKKKNTVTPFL